MTREWQEASNEYLKVSAAPAPSWAARGWAAPVGSADVICVQEQNVEPITGISSPDYKGRGMVQSGPAKKE